MSAITNTPLNVDLCSQEAIHIPGSIQPHGMMLVVERESLKVLQAAGNVEGHLGITGWEDLPLNALIGDRLCAEVVSLVRSEALGGFIGQLEDCAGDLFDVSVHLSGSFVIVELEVASPESRPASYLLDRLALAAAGFERAASLAVLCERAAKEFRSLTAFDRVMVYRFLDDGAGMVLAEDRRADLPTFLNHHFPASDIPVQARALYLRNLIRVIPDVAYQPVALRPPRLSTVPLDMSDSGLRSVSPVHIQYLANMGVKASASVSIVKDNTLWGLIACHNDTPRSLTYDIRAACRSLAGSLSRQIRAKEEAEGYRQRIRLRSFEDEIVALLSREGSLDEALSNHLDEIGRMMTGNGVVVLRGRELVMSGICPSERDVRALARWLLERPAEPIFSTDRLSELYSPAKEFQASSGGVLAMTLSTDEPWLILWFRVELVQTVDWAGNPNKAGVLRQQGPLTPRTSFASWRETVRGRSRRWTLAETDAATRMRTALLEVRQNRRVRELNSQLTKILQDKDLLLQQKEFLIGEVNHRVQNSLQLVSSFLGIQARASDNPELNAALEEARRRLTAVALVHRRLYRGDQIELVDAARYIEELCADTFSFMGQDWAQHLTLSLSPVLIPTDRAVSLGLVLTELLINSNKYAYAGNAGPIEIELIEDRTHLHLIVADRGSGRSSTRKGFGSRIMDALVAQLGGVLTQSDNRPGVRVTVTVPIEPSKSTVDVAKPH
jgi:two-component system, chemotaxis family, sensor kinase Cph1